MKYLITFIIAAVAINVYIFTRDDKQDTSLRNVATGSSVPNNVSVVDGKQIVTITAKGGYSPRMTTAKADMPTTIKVVTRGTFDCSSALTIPSLSYQKNLPSTGETLIDVPPQSKGTTLKGLCSMGMYSFSIKFE